MNCNCPQCNSGEPHEQREKQLFCNECGDLIYNRDYTFHERPLCKHCFDEMLENEQ